METLFQEKERRRPPVRAPRGRGLRALEYLLLAVGFVCIGIYGYSRIESFVYQSYQDYLLDASLQKQQPTFTGYVRHLYSDMRSGGNSADDRAYDDLEQNEQKENPAPRIAPPPDGLIGRIEIPRVNVSAIVREGVDSRTLRRAAGHVPGTALPGDEGNVAIAAHRDTFFRGVRDLTLNDTIRVKTTHGTFEYVVRSTEIVKPTDVQVLNARRRHELTLITCYPFNYIGHAPKRYIVKAEQVDSSAPAAVFGADQRQAAGPEKTASEKKSNAKKPKRMQHSRRYSAHVERLQLRREGI